MVSIAQLETRLTQVDRSRSQIEQEIAERRRNMTLKCGSCEGRSKIKNIELLNQQYYVEPYGCTGGAYWTHSEYNYDCPKCGMNNRFFFDTEYKLKYSERGRVRRAFWHIYRPLVKSVTEVYPERTSFLSTSRQFVNVHYDDAALKRFIGKAAFDELIPFFEDRYVTKTVKVRLK